MKIFFGILSLKMWEIDQYWSTSSKCLLASHLGASPGSLCHGDPETKSYENFSKCCLKNAFNLLRAILWPTQSSLIGCGVLDENGGSLSISLAAFKNWDPWFGFKLALLTETDWIYLVVCLVFGVKCLIQKTCLWKRNVRGNAKLTSEVDESRV